MFLAGVLAVFALITYFRPTFGLGLILALLPTYLIRYQILGIPTTFLELMLAVFLIIIFLSNLYNFPYLKKLGSIHWLILTFVVAGIISVFVSPDKHAAIGVFKAFIVEPVLFFYAVSLIIRKPTDLTTPLNLLFLGAIVVSVFGILQYATFIHLPLKFWGTGEEVERIVSVFDYPNALSLYLAPLIAFFLAAFIYDEKILNRRNLVIGLIVMISALILTFSRGAWLALALTIFVLLVNRYPLKRVLTGVCLLTALVFVVPATRQRLFLIARDSSSNARIDLMTAALTKLEQSPILGNGLAGFRTTLAEQNFPGEILNYPHNIFFNFWLEMGILGLISFLGIIIVSARRYLLNKTWYTIAAVAFMFTLIVHGLVDVPYFKNDLSVLFWFVISIFYI
jgi:putative inorganic carbon (HCO3(-)) transporter